MKKSIIQIIFASLVLISFISCNPSVNPDSNQDSNIKPFALNLSQFNQPENVIKTDVWATNHSSVKDTALQGSFFLYDKFTYEWEEKDKDYLDMILSLMR